MVKSYLTVHERLVGERDIDYGRRDGSIIFEHDLSGVVVDFPIRPDME